MTALVDRVAAPQVVSGDQGTSISWGIISGLMGICDGLIIVLVSLAFYLGYVGWNPETYPIYLAALTADVTLTLSLLHFAGLYRIESIVSSPRQFHKVILVCGAVFFILVTLGFSLKISEWFSRVWIFSSFITSTFLICVLRGLSDIAIRSMGHAGYLTRNLAIVGGEEQGERMLAHLREHKEPWRRLIGVFDDRAERIGPSVLGYPMLGTLDDLVDYVRENRIDDLIITIPWNADKRITEIINKLREMPVGIYLGSDLIGYRFPHLFRGAIGNMPVIEVLSKPLSGWRTVIKFIEDMVLASVLVVVASPLLLFIAAAIKLDSKGPVLFRQARFGFNNQVITVLKFRTMFHGRPPEKGVPQAKQDDPRVTRVGRILRHTSMDELPQIFNVLQGKMSLVGPRPHAVEHNEHYAAIIGGYFGRHKVKPGITGWAQINGLRGETDTPDKMEARVKHDVYYIDHWSLMFDLYILAMTPYVLLTNRNIY